MTTGIAARNVLLGSSSTFNVARTINLLHHPTNNAAGLTGFELLIQNVAKVARHDSGEIAAVGRCHPGTRIKILKELNEWATAPSYPSPIKWIHGTVGLGKSTILKTTCRYLSAQGLLMAAFLLPRLGDSRHKFTQCLIPTLAYELSISIPKTRPHIEQAVMMDPLIFSQSLEAQTRALIILPLLRLDKANPLSAPHPRVIVVGGLDECSGEKQQEILQTLMYICRHTPFPLAILVASRPEPYILNRFNRHDLYNLSERVGLDGFARDANRDIRKYYKDNFDDIRINHRSRWSLPSGWPPAGQVDSLVRRTSGHCGFAAAVVGFVKSMQHNPAHQLAIILGRASIPQTFEAFSPLDQLYATILRNIEPKFRSGAIRILGVLLVLTDEPITLTVTPTLVERLLCLEEGDARNLLFDVQSLIQVEPESSQLIIAHNSLREFLSDKSRANDLYINPSTVYEDLAKSSIFLLMDGVGEDLQELVLGNILTFFERADPTTDLRSFIEVGIKNLSKIYFSSTIFRLVTCPLFYEAVKSSKLEDASMLSERIFQSYNWLLLESIRRYSADDPSTTCLILFSRCRGEHEGDECFYQMALDIFDKFPDTRVLDREHGLCLRDIVLSHSGISADLPDDPILRAVDPSRATISRLVDDVQDCDKLYSKTARHLLGYIFTDSPYHVPAMEVLSIEVPTVRKCCFGAVLSHTFPDVLALSPPDPELYQYITTNHLSEDYQELGAIVNAIHDYLERTAEALKLPPSPFSSGMDAPVPLTSKTPEELTTYDLGSRCSPPLGSAHAYRITQDMQRSLPGWSAQTPRKAKSLS